MGMSLTDKVIRLLLEQGLPMLPSKGRQKKPCVPWKAFQNRRPTADEISYWDHQFRPNRWGFVTGKLSGRIVVDFDGDAGLEWMEKWAIKPHLRTGSGGYHLHVVHPGWKITTMNAKASKALWPWPGVDIRGDGGFAVLLGRNSNGPYTQLRELAPNPFDVLPEEVRTFLRDHSEKDAKLKPTRPRPQRREHADCRVDAERLIGNAVKLSRNGRNDAGFWLACQLRDNGYDMREAESAMRCYLSSVSSANAKGQREPYTEREMLASLSQAYSRLARDPWQQRKRAPLEERKHPRDAGQMGQRELVGNTLNANTSESIGIYVDHPSEPLVVHPGEPLSRAQYSRVPREVSSDPRLKVTDLRVYAVLASLVWQGSTVSLGKRAIAKRAPCAQRKVVESLTRLEVFGHIQRVPRKQGQRGFYRLTSFVFGQKQRAGAYETIAAPDGRRRLASVRKDPRAARTPRG